MKKYALLLALALAAGAVSAQTAPQVSVYGKVREYQESYTSGTASSISRLTNDSSRLGVKATTDVGDGITATAILETGVAVDAPSATTLGDRTAIVNLSNSLGSLGMGRDKHSVARVLDDYDAFNNAYGTISTTIHSAQGSRLQNGLFVNTASIAGFKGEYVMANSETAGTTNVQTGSIGYTLGPVSATVARYDDSSTSTSTIVGAKYKLASTTLFAMYSDDQVSGVQTSGSSVGISQSISAHIAVQGTYGQTNTNVTGRGLGVTYAMNKALSFHGRWSYLDAATDVNQYGVGVEFNF